MKRVLVATTAVLAVALAFLLFQRFTAEPPAPPQAAEAQAVPPAPATPPAPARGAQAGPAKTDGPATPAPAEAAVATAARPAPPQAPTVAREAGPKASKRADQPLPDAAAAAIFGDRPAGEGEGGHSRTPRIPVLRKLPAGVAPPPHVAAVVHPAGKRPAAPAPSTAAPGRGPATHPAVAAGPARPADPAPRLLGAVSGTLRSAASGPLPGTTILAVAAGGEDAFETVTDDDGFYLLAGMKPGRYLLFTGLGARTAPALPARAVEVQDGRVARVELREPAGGATVRVRPLGEAGRPLPGQVLLVAGALPSPTTFAALLRSDAIFLPEAGAPSVLRRVPAGVYTLVVLQGADAAPRVARQPVAVRGDGEQVLEVPLPAEVATSGAGPRG